MVAVLIGRLSYGHFFFCFDEVHRLGDSATHPIEPLATLLGCSTEESGFAAVPAFAPDLTKIVNPYRRHDPPSVEEMMAASKGWGNLSLSSNHTSTDDMQTVKLFRRCF